MEGMLLGTIVRARNKRLLGCELRAAYRLRFDPSRGRRIGRRGRHARGGDRLRLPRPAGARLHRLHRDADRDRPEPARRAGRQLHRARLRRRADRRHAHHRPWGAASPASTWASGPRSSCRCPAARSRRRWSTSPRPPTFEAFETGGASAGALTMTVGQNVAETLRITGTAHRPRGDHRAAERDAAAALLLRGRLATPRARRPARPSQRVQVA